MSPQTTHCHFFIVYPSGGLPRLRPHANAIPGVRQDAIGRLGGRWGPTKDGWCVGGGWLFVGASLLANGVLPAGCALGRRQAAGYRQEREEPLSPTLSRKRERELNGRRRNAEVTGHAGLPPLPPGEGWGEGTRRHR